MFLADWVAYKAGMHCSVRSLSLAIVPYSMKNLIAYFQVVFCSRNRNLLGSYVTVQYETKRDCFCSQLHCIELNAPRTNFSIKQLRGENREPYRTGPDQLYPRAFALRPNRALFVLAIFKRVIGEEMLALRLRTSAT